MNNCIICNAELHSHTTRTLLNRNFCVPCGEVAAHAMTQELNILIFETRTQRRIDQKPVNDTPFIEQT